MEYLKKDVIVKYGEHTMVAIKKSPVVELATVDRVIDVLKKYIVENELQDKYSNLVRIIDGEHVTMAKCMP